MLEIISNNPFLLLCSMLVPALLVGALIYYFNNKKWDKKHSDLQVFYNQSQRDNKTLRVELTAEKEKLKAIEIEKSTLNQQLVELENELIEEINDKNTKLSQLELRLEKLEKDLSIEKLSNLPNTLQNKRVTEQPNQGKKASSTLPQKANDTADTLQKTGEALKERITGLFKKLTQTSPTPPNKNGDNTDALA